MLNVGMVHHVREEVCWLVRDLMIMNCMAAELDVNNVMQACGGCVSLCVIRGGRDVDAGLLFLCVYLCVHIVYLFLCGFWWCAHICISIRCYI